MVSQGSYCIPKLTLVHWGSQPGFLLYTQAESGLLGWSARVPIVYLSQLWFTRVVYQGSYCIPQLTLVHWGGQPGLLKYTPANSGLLGCSARAPNIHPSRLWFIGVISQGFYCIQKPNLAHWDGQPGFLLHTPADSDSLEWSVRVLFVYSS